MRRRGLGDGLSGPGRWGPSPGTVSLTSVDGVPDAGRQDETVLVEVERTAKFPESHLLALIRTPFGHTAVPWHGAPDAAAGQYHVEWTIDEEIIWGRNAKPAAGTAAALGQEGHCVIIRGRLNLTLDGAAFLNVDGEQIQLDLANPIPTEASEMWIDLHLQRENIALYPYDL